MLNTMPLILMLANIIFEMTFTGVSFILYHRSSVPDYQTFAEWNLYSLLSSTYRLQPLSMALLTWYMIGLIGHNLKAPFKWVLEIYKYASLVLLPILTYGLYLSYSVTYSKYQACWKAGVQPKNVCANNFKRFGYKLKYLFPRWDCYLTWVSLVTFIGFLVCLFIHVRKVNSGVSQESNEGTVNKIQINYRSVALFLAILLIEVVVYTTANVVKRYPSKIVK